MSGDGIWAIWGYSLLGLGSLGCAAGLLQYRNRWKAALEQLQAQNDCIHTITVLAGVAIFEFDLEKRRYVRFDNAQMLFGLTKEEMSRQYKSIAELPLQEALHKMLKQFYHPEDLAEVFNWHIRLQEQKAVCFEGRINKPKVGYIWCRIHLFLIKDQQGEPRSIIGHIADIDEQRRCMEGLKIQAETDALSGLHNRAAIVGVIDTILQRNPSASHCLMLLDVDNFKAVNDNLGHVFGDSVLVEISRRLKQAVRGQDFVGRIGGDEFVIFMPHMQQAGPALQRAAALCANFQNSCSGKDEAYSISFSIGLAMSDGEQSVAELLHKADIAMYQAKADGKNRYHLYDGTEQVPQTEVLQEEKQ